MLGTNTSSDYATAMVVDALGNTTIAVQRVRGGVQRVDEVARCVQTANRIGERGQRLFHVSGCPGGQAEVAAAGTPQEVVLWSGQVQDVPGMAYGAGDIAA